MKKQRQYDSIRAYVQTLATLLQMQHFPTVQITCLRNGNDKMLSSVKRILHLYESSRSPWIFTIISFS